MKVMKEPKNKWTWIGFQSISPQNYEYKVSTSRDPKKFMISPHLEFSPLIPNTSLDPKQFQGWCSICLISCFLLWLCTFSHCRHFKFLTQSSFTTDKGVKRSYLYAQSGHKRYLIPDFSKWPSKIAKTTN